MLTCWDEVDSISGIQTRFWSTKACGRRRQAADACSPELVRRSTNSTFSYNFSVKQTINHFLAPPSAHKSIQRRHVRLGSLIYLCITIVQPSRANTKVLFLSLHSLVMHLYPLIGRHNRSSNSVAGDEAQLRTMFQKHVAWGGKTILHVRNGSLRASSKWKSYNQRAN